MSNIMQGGAVVEPAALNKMKQDTDKLGSNLKSTSQHLLKRVEELNTRGFQDGNFDQLNHVIVEHTENLNKLCLILAEFSDYLDRAEKNISAYVNGPKLSSSKIKVG